MNETLQFVLKHGYSLLAAWVFAEQIGLPLPATPVLLAAGALAGAGQMNFAAALGVSVLASVVADTAWYQLGKSRGSRVLQLLCRIALEPDSCVRRTEGMFERQGANSLLFAKFIPGLGTVTPPLAGVFHMRLRRFLVYDAAGAAIWSGSFLLLGYVFSNQIEKIAARAETLGASLILVLLTLLLGYIGYKLLARRHFLRELRIGRITPEELRTKLEAGEKLKIVDLRHALDFAADPEIIPGAVRMDVREMETSGSGLPFEGEVILYCT